MIGDWVFVILATLIFLPILVLSIMVINAAEGISAVDRKDNNMNDAYNSIITAGYMGLIVSIIGLVMIFFAILILSVGTLKNMIFVNDISKIIIKSIYGLITATIVCLAGYNMNNAANSILRSNTYKFAKFGAKKLLDSSIKLINLAAIAYYTFGAILFVIFIALGIYDNSKGPTEPNSDEVLDVPKKAVTSSELS